MKTPQTVVRLFGAAALLCTLSACEGVGALSVTNSEGEATETGVGSTSSAGSTGGMETETDTDTTETSGAGEPVCGDGVVEDDELCDQGAFEGQSCASQGFVDRGEIACAEACTFDLSGCVACSGWIDERGTAAYDEAAGSAIDSAANVYFVGRSGGCWPDLSKMSE